MPTVLQEPERAPTPLPADWSIADLQHFLGDVAAERIRLFPSPGTATPADLLWLLENEGRVCELIDGVLVEKDMASFESYLAHYLSYLLNAYLALHPIGAVSGERGPFRFPTSSVRIPDVAVALWSRFPNGKMPISQPIFEVVPNLAVEVLSQGNTRREMELKRDEYLEVGVELIWYINPRARTASVYANDGTVQHLDEHGTLRGGSVLPGFELPLQPFFDHFPVEPA